MSVKGEKYSSSKMMKKHEKSEGKKEMLMEYGKVKAKPKAQAGKRRAAKKGK